MLQNVQKEKMWADRGLFKKRTIGQIPPPSLRKPQNQSKDTVENPGIEPLTELNPRCIAHLIKIPIILFFAFSDSFLRVFAENSTFSVKKMGEPLTHQSKNWG